jgi:MGT family glycosyltransferase
MTPRRYLFALVDGGGNVPPELAAARRLIERGHAVTVLADDSVASDVRSTGAQLQRWTRAPNRPDRRPESDPLRDWECRYPWQLVDRLIDTLLVGPAADYAADVNDAIERARPALMVCSMFCIGGMLAAEAAGVPSVVLFPNIYLLPAHGMPPFGVGFLPARGPIGRFRDRVLNRFIEHLWDSKGLAGLNALRRRHGLAPLEHVLDQVRGARRQLVMTSPALDFPATLPAGARYVGPVLDDPPWSRASSWTPPAGSDPLVLVAMSSTFQDQVGPLRSVIAALGTLPVRGIVTTGPAIDPEALTAASNVTVLASAPHRDVLQHADVVVTHGGHGTVVKALAAGVPMVLLPHGRDQADTAVRVAARGAGITLRRTARPRAISAAVRRVLADPSYRTAAQQLGESVRRDADSTGLVRELEGVAASLAHDDRDREREHEQIAEHAEDHDGCDRVQRYVVLEHRRQDEAGENQHPAALPRQARPIRGNKRQQP